MTFKKSIVGHRLYLDLTPYHPNTYKNMQHPRMVETTGNYMVVEFYSNGDYDENAKTVVTELIEIAEKMSTAEKVKDRILKSLSPENTEKKRLRELGGGITISEGSASTGQNIIIQGTPPTQSDLENVLSAPKKRKLKPKRRRT